MLDRDRCILFDWGDTLMRDFPEFSGPMSTWPHVEAIPHASDVLARLHDAWVVGLATNAADSDETDIWAALRRVGLDAWIDKIYCFRSVGQPKSSPAFFDHILNDLRIGPENVIVVGNDFKADVLRANRAGIRAVWFNEHTRETKVGEMHATVHSLDGLPSVLEKLALFGG